MFIFTSYQCVLCLALKGERGSPGDKGPTGPKGKRVSLFAVAIHHKEKDGDSYIYL